MKSYCKFYLVSLHRLKYVTQYNNSQPFSGNIIVSGSTDRTLKVWNADAGTCIHTLYGHTSTVRCMHLHNNRYVFCFLKNGPNPASFWFIFVLFHNTRTNFTLNDKSIDGVLGSRTRGGMMEGADVST